jgi:nucleoside-diphosphate kinase
MSNRTLVIAKPDAVERGLVGEIIRRFEQKQLKLDAVELRLLTREIAEAHYAEHQAKGFFGDLIDFITRSPVVLMVVSGPDAQPVVRRMMGTTNPAEAAAGTIRGDFAIETTENLVHGSDSSESAESEIARFFPQLAAK